MAEPSTLTAVRKPVAVVGFTHADTEKLCAVSTTGAGASTAASVPLNATPCGPTTPSPQVAPPVRVAVRASRESSAAVVPVPSSRRQCPAMARRAASAAVSAPV